MYDIVVIGGGIHGAGVAQAAAVNGYSVLLLEKNQIAHGTSSKSSKLIHGGLRYLESGQFSLVKECLQERELLLKNAPHLVELKPFLIPIYSNTKRSALTIRTGLSLYALLNGFKSSGRFKSIPKKEWQTLDGLLRDDLQHVFQYCDAQTDDRLLTQAVIKSAQDYSAEVVTNAEFSSAQFDGSCWSLQYKVANDAYSAQAKVVVNAAGPWVNFVKKRFSPSPKLVDVDLVQGTHIVLEGKVTKGIYYLEAPQDKRAVFVMPWYGDTMVGTTELNYRGEPDQVIATSEEIDYLLQIARHYFPKYSSVTQKDVKQSFAGLRVLPSASGSAFSRSRETIIHEDNVNSPQLFSIYGGKLTAYRATAENVIREIKHYLPHRKTKGDTKNIRLPVI